MCGWCSRGVPACRTGLRTETSIIAETAQAFSTHHIAVLVGYGAHAVVPYLAFETCRQWRASPRCTCLSRHLGLLWVQ